MKALSIRQPYANQILYTGKDIENRSWATDVRGFIAIHASGSVAEGFTWDDKEILRRFPSLQKSVLLPSYVNSIKASIYLPKNYKKSVVLGAIVGVVEIVDCVRSHKSPHFDASFSDVNYGFVLSNPIPLPKPIYLNGKLGLWTVPSDAEKQVKVQLKGHKIEFAE